MTNSKIQAMLEKMQNDVLSDNQASKVLGGGNPPTDTTKPNPKPVPTPPTPTPTPAPAPFPTPTPLPVCDNLGKSY